MENDALVKALDSFRSCKNLGNTPSLVSLNFFCCYSDIRDVNPCQMNKSSPLPRIVAQILQNIQRKPGIGQTTSIS